MTEEYSHTDYHYQNEDQSFCVVLAADFKEAAQSPSDHEHVKASLYLGTYNCFFTETGKYVALDGKAGTGPFESIECKQAEDDENTLVADIGKGITLRMNFNADGQTMSCDGAFVVGKPHATQTLQLTKQENHPKP